MGALGRKRTQRRAIHAEVKKGRATGVLWPLVRHGWMGMEMAMLEGQRDT